MDDHSHKMDKADYRTRTWQNAQILKKKQGGPFCVVEMSHYLLFRDDSKYSCNCAHAYESGCVSFETVQ